MIIRLAVDNDVPMLSALYTEFFAYNSLQLPQDCFAAKENGKYPATVINGKSGDIIVAEIDLKIVGFVHIEEESTLPYASVVPHKFACVVDFFVNEQYRKNGIGRLLLAEVRNWAQARNLEYLELKVLEKNDIGRNFYERENFLTMSRTMRLEI